jgi:hypothetical protein
MVGGQPTQVRQIHQRFVIPSLLREPTWGLGREEESKAHDARGDELESKWNTPYTRPGLDMQVNTVCNAIISMNHDKTSSGVGNQEADRRTVDEVADHDTSSDEHLKHTRDTSSDLLGGALGHIRRGDGGNGAHPQPSNNTTRVNVA